MPPLNRAQRAVLTLMLVIDGLLCVFPPFVRRGHHWLFAYPSRYASKPYVEFAHVSFAQLALEIFIVAVIGATAVVVVRAIPDGRIGAWLRERTMAFRRILATPTPRQWWMLAGGVGMVGLIVWSVGVTVRPCSFLPRHFILGGKPALLLVWQRNLYYALYYPQDTRYAHDTRCAYKNDDGKVFWVTPPEGPDE